MPSHEPNDLEPGDRVELALALKITGVVSRKWAVDDDDGGTTSYIAVVDYGRGERLLRVNHITRATVLERGVEIPSIHGRKPS